jgi:alpha-beta hydrolase superfamily lysophospholipase
MNSFSTLPLITAQNIQFLSSIIQHTQTPIILFIIKHGYFQTSNNEMLIVHGIDDYGGRMSEHVDKVLKEGFRVIAMDLPSFGRSSGRHAYLNDWKELTEAVRCVI